MDWIVGFSPAKVSDVNVWMDGWNLHISVNIKHNYINYNYIKLLLLLSFRRNLAKLIKVLAHKILIMRL